MSDDAFALSESLRPRPFVYTVLGWLLAAVGFGCGVLIVSGVLFDVFVVLFTDVTTDQLTCMMLGLPVRIGVLGLIGVAAMGASREMLWPDQYGKEIQAAGALHSVYEAHGLDAVDDLDPGDYVDMAASQLADVHRNLHRDRYPERYSCLLGAIKRFVERSFTKD